MAFAQDPSDRSVQFVVEQGGRIRAIKDRALVSTPFLNVASLITAGGEQGLLGLAFSPDYASSGRFFICYTRAGDGATVVARYKRSADPLVADPASGFPLIWSTGNAFIPQPFTNHNGGTLAFGSDGYLYIGLGDGGSGNDPSNYAQRTDQLLGKILRVDVNVSDAHPQGFVIPAGNPGLARPEIWSLGLRNPWKFSFDDAALGGTGAMIIGDVGQGAREEIDYEPAGRGGRNYGWRNFEGTLSNVTSIPPSPPTPTPPIFEYDHSAGQAIIGGYVYRGSAMPAWRGRYFFADYGSRRVWSLGLIVNGSTGDATAGTLVEHTQEFGGTTVLGNISAFGVDANGELYLVSYSTGSVLRIGIVPSAPTNLQIMR